jgi:hypothetical protein
MIANSIFKKQKYLYTGDLAYFSVIKLRFSLFFIEARHFQNRMFFYLIPPSNYTWDVGVL